MGICTTLSVFRGNVPCLCMQSNVTVVLPVSATKAVCCSDGPVFSESCLCVRQVRLYDTASGQRRPVISMTVGDEEPLTCLSRTHRDHQVSHGLVGLLFGPDTGVKRRRILYCPGALPVVTPTKETSSYARIGSELLFRPS